MKSKTQQGKHSHLRPLFYGLTYFMPNALELEPVSIKSEIKETYQPMTSHSFTEMKLLKTINLNSRMHKILKFNINQCSRGQDKNEACCILNEPHRCCVEFLAAREDKEDDDSSTFFISLLPLMIATPHNFSIFISHRTKRAMSDYTLAITLAISTRSLVSRSAFLFCRSSS